MPGTALTVRVLLASRKLGHRCETVLIHVQQVVVVVRELLPCLAALPLDMLNHGRQHGLPGARLLLLLHVRPARQTERADQHRQGQTLHHQRHQDHAKREKDDQIALRERLPIAQLLGQRKRRR